jgi:hypothetical protein
MGSVLQDLDDVGANSFRLPQRAGLERARSISAWVKDYGAVLDV